MYIKKKNSALNVRNVETIKNGLHLKWEMFWRVGRYTCRVFSA